MTPRPKIAIEPLARAESWLVDDSARAGRDGGSVGFEPRHGQTTLASDSEPSEIRKRNEDARE